MFKVIIEERSLLIVKCVYTVFEKNIVFILTNYISLNYHPSWNLR